MPIFEFRCKKCGKEFEEVVLGSTAKVICPACASEDTEKLMSTGCFKSAADGGMAASTFSSGASSSCGSCTGGNCSSCHH